MILLLALAFGVMAVLNYAISRHPLYPPLVFCCVWTAEMIGLWFAGDYFYPISEKTLWIFLFGAVAFTSGGFVALLLKMRPYQDPVDRKSVRYIDLMLKAGFIAGVLLLPAYWHYLNGMLEGADIYNFYKQLRLASMKHNGVDNGEISIVPLVVPILVVLSTISLYEFCRTGIGALRTCGGLLVALIYQVASMARSQVLILLVSLFAAAWFNSPKRALRWGAVGVSAFMVLFFANALLIEKAGAKADESVGENAPQLLKGFVVYAIGSAVAFDGTVRNPSLIPNTFPLFSYFTRALNKFGFEMEKTNPFYDDISVNSTVAINTYTTYFSPYSDYGFTFTIGYMAVLGFIASLVFRKAITNDPVYILLFGAALYCTFMTFFEGFFIMEIGFWIKTFVIGIIFYRVIPAIARYKQEAEVSPPLIA
jgi:oligosaccharide repeat unit polymerase